MYTKLVVIPPATVVMTTVAGDGFKIRCKDTKLF